MQLYSMRRVTKGYNDADFRAYYVLINDWDIYGQVIESSEKLVDRWALR